MDETAKLDGFFRDLKNNGRGLLLLDYDGTIAPFVSDRLRATPDPGIKERLSKILAARKSHVVFVSGRPCMELLDLAELDHPVEVWGCHGREYSDLEGNVSYHGVTPELQDILVKNREQVASFLPPEKVELKTGCLAFHWRGVPEDQLRNWLDRFEDEWQRTAKEKGLLFLRFDGGIELAIPGRSKGHAIQELLAEHGEDGLPIAFLGDDLTDEDGFRALGQRGLSVLVRDEPRETEADIRVLLPEGVIDFLDRWIEAEGG